LVAPSCSRACPSLRRTRSTERLKSSVGNSEDSGKPCANEMTSRSLEECRSPLSQRSRWTGNRMALQFIGEGFTGVDEDAAATRLAGVGGAGSLRVEIPLTKAPAMMVVAEGAGRAETKVPRPT